ncbi:hypothetical protein FQA39_LY12098 [Lamprigera yunnana]|nr:hypothetical protein FQA39_LY12098 [Lamprigera yunnana]
MYVVTVLQQIQLNKQNGIRCLNGSDGLQQYLTRLIKTSVKIMNIDPKGIKRGGCKGESCEECDAYTYNTKEGSRCDYCYCPPTTHIRIDEFHQISSVKKQSSIQDASSSQEELMGLIQEENYYGPLDKISPQEVSIFIYTQAIFEINDDGTLLPLSPGFFKPQISSEVESIVSEVELPLHSDNNKIATPKRNQATVLSTQLPQEKNLNATVIQPQTSALVEKIASSTFHLDIDSQSNSHTTKFYGIISRLSRCHLFHLTSCQCQLATTLDWVSVLAQIPIQLGLQQN